MTVRTEIPTPIPSLHGERNAPAGNPFPRLARARARGPHAGPTLVAAVWMLALAFFVLAVAAPAAVMERTAAEARAAAVAGGVADARR
ncbi:MAG TPA: hypothetical protein VFM53_02735 [Anaeromyxobacteraceae bacterium]|nr:hypothetical protein [Anaeromyxobacteraceae bacterium]